MQSVLGSSSVHEYVARTLRFLSPADNHYALYVYGAIALLAFLFYKSMLSGGGRR